VKKFALRVPWEFRLAERKQPKITGFSDLISTLTGGLSLVHLQIDEPVAQWIEHLPTEQRAGGSNPSWLAFLIPAMIKRNHCTRRVLCLNPLLNNFLF
jgi:hypothetical protein